MKRPHDWVIDQLTRDLVRMTEERDHARDVACRLEQELAHLKGAATAIPPPRWQDAP